MADFGISKQIFAAFIDHLSLQTEYLYVFEQNKTLGKTLIDIFNPFSD